MKKLLKSLKNYHPNKELLILYLFVPFIVLSFSCYKVLDNDRFFLISLGRHIVNHGFPTVDPLSMHHAGNFIIQQWLVDVIFYYIYKYIGNIGFVFLTVILFALMNIIFYKLCNLVNKNRYALSTILTFVFSCMYLLLFLRTRPQLFEAVILLEELYLLEKYIDTSNKKYLYYLPFLSLLMINIHASCFFMMFAFILPYILNIRTNYTDNEKYDIKSILLVTVIMGLTGLINPYGYKSITYLFSSFGFSVINELVTEMNPLSMESLTGKIVICFIGIILFIYILARKKIKIRYLFLLLGTLFLGLSHFKGVQYFLLASIFPVGSILKDKFYSNNEKLSDSVKPYFYFVLCVLIALPCFIILSTKNYPNGVSETPMILEYLNEHVEDKKSVKIYTDYNTGGYFELDGYVPYLDPRAEIFLENGVLEEFVNIQKGYTSYSGFLDKYDFDYLVVDAGSMFSLYYLSTSNNKNYRLVLNELTSEEAKIGYNLYEKVS